MADPTQLEAAIESDPDNPAGYMVYGDWLQSRGDVRGELIALQLAGNTRAAKKLIDRFPSQFWGGAADSLRAFEPGSFHHQTTLLGAPTTWRWGFLRSVWL